ISRPGGLTAIAVINTLIGLISMGGVVFSVFTADFIEREVARAERRLEDPEMPARLIPFLEKNIEANKEQLALLEAMAAHPLHIPQLAVGLVTGLAMFISGIGLWRMKKFAGRMIGNVFVVASLANAAIGFFVMRG